MDIKLLMTEFGTVLGNIIHEDINTGSLWIENPLLLTPAGDGRFHISPLIFGTTEKQIKIERSRLVAQNLLEPELALINKYNELFGSGIILAAANEFLGT